MTEDERDALWQEVYALPAEQLAVRLNRVAVEIACLNENLVNRDELVFLLRRAAQRLRPEPASSADDTARVPISRGHLRLVK